MSRLIPLVGVTKTSTLRAVIGEVLAKLASMPGGGEVPTEDAEVDAVLLIVVPRAEDAEIVGLALGSSRSAVHTLGSVALEVLTEAEARAPAGPCHCARCVS